MADATNNRKRVSRTKPATPKAKPTPKSPRASKAATGTTEPALLTATEALSAAQAATGETPVTPKRQARSPKPAPKPASKVSAAEPAKKAPAVAIPAEPVVIAEPVPPAPVEPTPEPIAAMPSAEAEMETTSGGNEPAEEEAKPIETTAPEAIEPPVTAHYATEGTAVMTDVMETTKKFAEDTKAKFESAFADFNTKAKAGVEKSAKAMEEISDLAKGNVEAFVESGKIAAKGVETLGQEAAEYGRKNFEKATATFKSFASVKSPSEFFQLQSELMSSAFDSFAKETAKNSEAFMKLAGDVAQPISTRVSIVTEKVKSLAA